jgi:hypothetical protein
METWCGARKIYENARKMPGKCQFDEFAKVNF